MNRVASDHSILRNSALLMRPSLRAVLTVQQEIAAQHGVMSSRTIQTENVTAMATVDRLA